MIDLNTPLANGIVIKNNILLFQRSCLSQWYGAFKGQENGQFWWGSLAIALAGFGPSEPQIHYNCAEQAMMWAKAQLFQDYDTSSKIMKAKQPAEQKKLGREVKNYNEATWNKHKFNIIYHINATKFGRNPELKEFLLSTGHLILAEAAPWDKIWGIGLGPDDPLAHDVSTWQGQNLLGRVLMAVREELSHE